MSKATEASHPSAEIVEFFASDPFHMQALIDAEAATYTGAEEVSQ